MKAVARQATKKEEPGASTVHDQNVENSATVIRQREPEKKRMLVPARACPHIVFWAVMNTKQAIPLARKFAAATLSLFVG
jgi:hypothetical protein